MSGAHFQPSDADVIWTCRAGTITLDAMRGKMGQARLTRNANPSTISPNKVFISSALIKCTAFHEGCQLLPPAPVFSFISVHSRSHSLCGAHWNAWKARMRAEREWRSALLCVGVVGEPEDELEL